MKNTFSFILRFCLITFLSLSLLHQFKIELWWTLLPASNASKTPSEEPINKHNGNGSSWENDIVSPLELNIENSVLFTDHVLVIFPRNDSTVSNLQLSKEIDCVYHKQLNGSYDKKVNDTIAYPALSRDDEYAGESSWIIWCPIPPVNYSVSVGLEGYGTHNNEGFDWIAKLSKNQTLKSWGMLAYEAAFDGEKIVAVFVKGLRLNGDKKSDPNKFRCRFGDDFALATMAITAAQEVIRCPLPRSVSRTRILKHNEIVQVTIERTTNDSKAQRKSYVVPSIAKLHKSNYHNKDGHQYKICACTMVWNQAAFLKEWIMYHGWLGIQRWFVYDNNSNDGLKEVINDLNSENYNVSRHVWPWLKSQEAGFSHCVLRAKGQCKWIAFFDVDEFFYFPPQTNTQQSTIKAKNHYSSQNFLQSMVKNVESNSPLVGEIVTNCHNFGPSGLKKSPIEGVTLGYTCRVRRSDRHKSIVRSDAIDESLLNRVHHFELRKGFTVKKLSSKTAVINHYKYQVWDVFKTKFVRRVSTYVANWQDNKSERSKDRTPGLGKQAIEPPNWHQRFCDVRDTGLRDFIIQNFVDSKTKLFPWQNRSTL